MNQFNLDVWSLIFHEYLKKNIKKKLVNICENESIKYTDNGINKLLFFSNYDIRQCINNLECILYTDRDVTIETIEDIIDIPKLEYIKKIIIFCQEKKLHDAILTIKKLYNRGYSPNDILLTFMKYIQSIDIHKIIDKESIRLKLYQIVSKSFIRVNDGVNTLLQLYGCVVNIYQLL